LDGKKTPKQRLYRNEKQEKMIIKPIGGEQYAVGYEYDVTPNMTFYAIW